MMTDPTTPQAWAIFLSRLWGHRFPVDVKMIASEYSNTRFQDPIRKIAPANVDTFEGALLPLPRRPGWAILYNPTIRSPGRVNFTLGHELGHYLLHRLSSPGGFQCGQSEALGAARNANLVQVEREADLFASYLLMPLDDFRSQVAAEPLSNDLLRHCADRYEVSLTAAALKWLEATNECAAVVVAVNGYVLWCRRSECARRGGIYFPSGLELHPASAAARGEQDCSSEGTKHGPGVWGRTAAREVAIFADSYEMTISLLIFEDLTRQGAEWRCDEVEDTFDRFMGSAGAR